MHHETLIGTRFAALLRRLPPPTWQHLAVSISPDGDRILRRSDLAAELRAADLTDLAAAVKACPIRPRHVLCLALDDDGVELTEIGPRGVRLLWPLGGA